MKKIFLSYLFSVTFILLNAAEIVPGKTYQINSINSGNKTLSVRNSSLDNRAEIITWTQTHVNAQRWKIEAASNNFYYLTNAYSGKVVNYPYSRPKAGDKVEQNPNGYSLNSQWELVPVNNTSYPNAFFIRYSQKSSEEYLYLERLDNLDGSIVTVQLKKMNSDSIRQMWQIEQTVEIPNAVTEELRNEIMKGWKDYYYKQAPTGHVLGNGGWWGDAEMFETVLDAYETTGDQEHKDMFLELYKNFVARNRTDWSYNEFNDDIAWMVIASARASLMFGDGRFLNHAKANFDKMYSRALLPSGMLRWKETPNGNQGTNSCINGPAGVAACYLAIATGDDSYYEKAKKLYALQRQYLYDPNTGKVFDSGVWNNGTFSITNHWVSTYNQGTFLGVALMLYNRYGDAMYKNDANKIVDWTKRDLCNAYGVIRVCGSGNDLQGFKGILMRYLRRYIVDLGLPNFVSWMQRNVLHGFNNRNSKGIIWTAWWEKSTENFIFSDGYNYVNQPFGASTAVSAAFNAPLDKDLIIKNPLLEIEAENFDYLKGIYVVKDSNGSNEKVVSNILNNFFTAYNNVEFGTDQIENATFRVLGGSVAGSIEIRLGSPTGELIGKLEIPANPGVWMDISCPVSSVTGRQNVYVIYKEEGYKLDYFRFNKIGTSVSKTINESSISIFPNPATSLININTTHSGNLIVFNSIGQQVFSSEISDGNTVLNIERYTPGYYFVRFDSNGEKHFTNFLKK